MLLVEDESEKEKEGRELMEETADCNDLEGVELSMNSVVGLTSPKTMKVRGTVKGQDVVVLIDSGATDNFMSWELIKELKPPVTETDGYKVQVGTGRAVNRIGKCRQNRKMQRSGVAAAIVSGCTGLFTNRDG